MSLNANVTAVCPTPSCGHDYKVTPSGESEHGRTFTAACANCGRAEAFYLYDSVGLVEVVVAEPRTIGRFEVTFDDLRGGHTETSSTSVPALTVASTNAPVEVLDEVKPVRKARK